MNWYKQALWDTGIKGKQGPSTDNRLVNNPINNKGPSVKPTSKQVFSPKPLNTDQRQIFNPVVPILKQKLPEAADYLKNPVIQKGVYNIFEAMSPKKNTDPFLGQALNRFDKLEERQQKEEAKREEAEVAQVGEEEQTYGNLAEENEQGANKKANVSIYEHREAYLINKDTGDKGMYLTCQYCGRWATHPINDKSGRSDYIWKKPEQLDPEEDKGVKDAIHQLHNTNYKDVIKSVSHGMCPICFSIAEKNFDLPKETIKELSLNHEELV